MCRTFLRENREVPSSPAVDGAVGRIGKARGRTPMMHDDGKSDGPVVPAKPPNKPAAADAEGVEERGPTKGNATQHNTSRTQSRIHGVHNGLDRVREAAKRNRETKFTALFHYITIERLRAAFFSLEKKAAAGVDGVTWMQYAEGLEERLQSLHGRVQRGSYRARPSRRVYIPKPDGSQRV